MDDLARFCCQNLDCSLYGRRDVGDLSVSGRLGKQKQFRQLYCNACRARFSERKGTPLYRCHLPEEKALAVLEHLDEGCGIRPTGRFVGVHRDTVVRLARAAGRHDHDAHEELVDFSPRTREVQFDEKWSFVAKKQKNCDPADPSDDHKGDWWDYVALDPEHRLVLAVVLGARSMENAEEVVAAVKGRTDGTSARLMTSDEYPVYASAIEAAFGAPVARPADGPGRRPILPERRLPGGLT
jgi:hypothetical protein